MGEGGKKAAKTTGRMKHCARYIRDRDMLVVTSAFVKMKLTANIIVKFVLNQIPESHRILKMLVSWFHLDTLHFIKINYTHKECHSVFDGHQGTERERERERKSETERERVNE